MNEILISFSSKVTRKHRFGFCIKKVGVSVGESLEMSLT